MKENALNGTEFFNSDPKEIKVPQQHAPIIESLATEDKSVNVSDIEEKEPIHNGFENTTVGSELKQKVSDSLNSPEKQSKINQAVDRAAATFTTCVEEHNKLVENKKKEDSESLSKIKEIKENRKKRVEDQAKQDNFDLGTSDDVVVLGRDNISEQDDNDKKDERTSDEKINEFWDNVEKNDSVKESQEIKTETDEIQVVDAYDTKVYEYDYNGNKPVDVLMPEIYNKLIEISNERTKPAASVMTRLSQQKGKHVNVYLPNSNLMLSVYPFKKLIKKQETLLRFTIQSQTNGMEDRSVMENILSNVKVLSSDNMMTPRDLMDIIDPSDEPIIYLASLIINMLDDSEKNTNLDLSITCPHCQGNVKTKVNILDLYRDNIDPNAYTEFSRYDKSKSVEDLQKGFPVGTVKAIIIPDDDRDLLITIKLRGLTLDKKYKTMAKLKSAVAQMEGIPDRIVSEDERYLYALQNFGADVRSKAGHIELMAPVDSIKVADKFNPSNSEVIDSSNSYEDFAAVFDSLDDKDMSQLVDVLNKYLSPKYEINIDLRPFKCPKCGGEISTDVDPKEFYFFQIAQNLQQIAEKNTKEHNS